MFWNSLSAFKEMKNYGQICGTDNEIPNQQLVSGNSLLTEGFAAGRCLSQGVNSLVLDTTNSAAANGLASEFNTAAGSYSFTSGHGSRASRDRPLLVLSEVDKN